jgi:hypothetical protein
MPYIRKTSDIITSHQLDSVLEEMKSNSEVARLLLKSRHSVENFVDNHINYIAISNSDATKISYLTQDRIDSLILKGEDLWTTPKRFHIKPGAFVGKLFKNIPQREVEIFSQLFKNIQTKIEFKFEVISGRDILHYYHKNSYYDEYGSLGNSCMKYDQCQDYLDLYTKNNKQISMLVLLSNNSKLIGRALLWNQDDIKLMDRIYTIDDERYQYHFKKWADDNGYWYKKEQKWNNSLFFESNGKPIYKEITLKLDYFDFYKFPYMDTFKFLDTSDGTISNIPRNSNVRTLLSTEGSTYGHDYLTICQKSKLFYTYDDTIYLDYLSMRVWAGLTVYSELYNIHILKDDADYDNLINCWIFSDDDLNNHDLLEKAREDRRGSSETQTLSSKNRWGEIVTENITFSSLSNTTHWTDTTPLVI